MPKERLEEETWLYILEREGDVYTFDAVCGHIGLYSKTVTLTAEQVERYHREGRDYLRQLAQQISDESAVMPRKTKPRKAGKNK